MIRILKHLLTLGKYLLMLTGLRYLWNRYVSLQPGLDRCREIIGEMKTVCEDSQERNKKLQKLLNK